MTLRELAARLNDIVAENDRHGWSERNDLAVFFRLDRGSVRKRDVYFPIRFASPAIVAVRRGDTEQRMCVVEERERDGVR